MPDNNNTGAGTDLVSLFVKKIGAGLYNAYKARLALTGTTVRDDILHHIRTVAKGVRPPAPAHDRRQKRKRGSNSA